MDLPPELGLAAALGAAVAAIAGVVVKCVRVLASALERVVNAKVKRIERQLARRGFPSDPPPVPEETPTAVTRRRKRRTFAERVILGPERRRTASDTDPTEPPKP